MAQLDRQVKDLAEELRNSCLELQAHIKKLERTVAEKVGRNELHTLITTLDQRMDDESSAATKARNFQIEQVNSELSSLRLIVAHKADKGKLDQLDKLLQTLPDEMLHKLDPICNEVDALHQRLARKAGADEVHQLRVANEAVAEKVEAMGKQVVADDRVEQLASQVSEHGEVIARLQAVAKDYVSRRRAESGGGGQADAPPPGWAAVDVHGLPLGRSHSALHLRTGGGFRPAGAAAKAAHQPSIQWGPYPGDLDPRKVKLPDGPAATSAKGARRPMSATNHQRSF